MDKTDTGRGIPPLYGSREFIYAAPVADALAENLPFRSWVLNKTRFSEHAESARSLHHEMAAARQHARYWWRSHFTESCRCSGCSGQETDLLALFECPDGYRFALHIEVKQPTDRFSKSGQAAAYRKRAQCWVEQSPKSILSHQAGAALLLFSEGKRKEFASYLGSFDALITFEELCANFPAIFRNH